MAQTGVSGAFGKLLRAIDGMARLLMSVRARKLRNNHRER